MLRLSRFVFPFLFASSLYAAPPPSESREIIVIGAGISGIAAARDLRKQGRNVIVLEARDRVGGRIWTKREWGTPLELGAGWIEGMRGNPLMKLARKMDLDVEDLGDDSMIVYDYEGEVLSDEDAAELEEGFEYFLEFVEAVREQAGKHDSVETAVQAFIGEEDLDPDEIIALNYLINVAVETDYVGDSSELSLLYFDQDSGFGGGSGVVVSGYDDIVKGMAEGLDVRLNHRVETIVYNQDGVRVKTNHGWFEGDYALCTLPLGVLKKGAVQFKPALPPDKQAAIDALRTGVLHRTYLQFDKVFWDAEVDSIGFISRQKGEWPVFLNLYKFTGKPILLGFTGGKYGRKMDRLPAKSVAGEAMKVLRKIYGRQIKGPVNVLTSNWGSDPLSGGAYSFVPAGATGAEYEALAEPVKNRLFFAGEATIRKYPGTVHGAYLSGLREAKRINALYK